ncbi:MAG: histidine phosphatase family protein [Fibrobacter sp.]|nr:histidine phosphatase family protein [Fibrobacter sp.]
MNSKILKVLAGLAFASILAACGDDDSSSTGADDISVRDSVVVHDSLNWIDSIRITDSLYIKDSVHYIDSIIYKTVERINVVDSTRIIDSINVIDSLYITFKDSTRIIDSLNIIDSLHITFMDSTRIVDSIVTYPPELYVGPCNASNAGDMKRTTVNGESRYYYCDMGTHLWRIATDAEINSIVNSAFVNHSHVTEFVPLDQVYNSVRPDEKMIVVLRHAEREDDISLSSPLTEMGKFQSQSLGMSLSEGGPGYVYYAGSQYVRTHQTCNFIARGRHDLDTTSDTMVVLNEGWFTKNFDSYFMTTIRENDDGRGLITKWAAEGGYTDVFYDLAPRSSELLEDYLIPALELSGRTVGVFVSHDVMIIPLLSYISEQRITFNYYKAMRGEWEGDNWLNYLAGIAVILKPDGSKVFYAVRGLDSGTMKLELE